MAKKRIIVLGAGLAGLSAAWHLQRKDIDCQVFEKESEVGGLCRSKHINGFTFDYDGHLLHFKHHYTFKLIKNLLGDNLVKHKRNAWIYFYGTYIPYPFQANLFGLPLPILKECLSGFVESLGDNRQKNNANLNFLNWINQTFGKGIAKHFMVPYNTKFWRVPPEKMTCDWLDGFIPIPSLGQIIEGAVAESKREFGYNAHFWYTKKGGIKQLPLAMATQVKNIFTGCQISEINLAKKEIKMISGDKERFDYLISTIPLPEMGHLIKGLSDKVLSLIKKLKWNSILNLNLGLDGKNDSRHHWVYFPQEKVCFFRAGFPHNFSSYLVPKDKSSLYIEVSYSKEKPLNQDNIALSIKKDLKKVGLLKKNDSICAQDINNIKYGYPIYDNNYRSIRDRIINFLRQNSIIACGRYGSWKYMSMEDAILDGERTFKLLKNV